MRLERGRGCSSQHPLAKRHHNDGRRSWAWTRKGLSRCLGGSTRGIGFGCESAPHQPVRTGGGDVEHLADRVHAVTLVKADRGRAGVAPEDRSTGLTRVVETRPQQKCTHASPAGPGRHRHAAQAHRRTGVIGFGRARWRGRPLSGLARIRRPTTSTGGALFGHGRQRLLHQRRDADQFLAPPRAEMAGGRRFIAVEHARLRREPGAEHRLPQRKRLGSGDGRDAQFFGNGSLGAGHGRKIPRHPALALPRCRECRAAVPRYASRVWAWLQRMSRTPAAPPHGPVCPEAHASSMRPSILPAPDGHPGTPSLRCPMAGDSISLLFWPLAASRRRDDLSHYREAASGQP